MHSSVFVTKTMSFTRFIVFIAQVCYTVENNKNWRLKRLKNYLISGLAHIGIVTADAQNCAKFYIDHLGFRPYYSYQKDDLCLEFVECGRCIIEFIQNGAVDRAGIVNHIALEVQGIEALVEELKAKGIVFETEEINKMPDFYPNGVKNIFFMGPAGERVELFDYSK